MVDIDRTWTVSQYGVIFGTMIFFLGWVMRRKGTHLHAIKTSVFSTAFPLHLPSRVKNQQFVANKLVNVNPALHLETGKQNPSRKHYFYFLFLYPQYERKENYYLYFLKHISMLQGSSVKDLLVFAGNTFQNHWKLDTFLLIFSLKMHGNECCLF